jgi:hypothetical protein
VSEAKDRDEPALAGPVAWLLGFGALAASGWAWAGSGLEATGVSAGVLLLVVALALLATALGQGAYGPETEGRLDLSARLGVGLLGGVLGGVAHLLVAWSAGALGLPDLLGVDLLVRLTPGELARQAASGAFWGLVFGAAYRRVPGRGGVARGLAFSLVPSLWVLAVVYPQDFKYGFFGVELGVLTFVVVILYYLVWGAVAGGLIRWAERTDVGPVSRPLGA